MTNLYLGTAVVSLDEPCVFLSENTRRVLVDGHSEDHRILTVGVMRDGQVARFTKDLGRANAFVGEPFYIPGLCVEKVGTLLDLAEKARDMKPLRVREGHEPKNIAESYRQFVSEWQAQRKGLSVYGPTFQKQRDI